MINLKSIQQLKEAYVEAREIYYQAVRDDELEYTEVNFGNYRKCYTAYFFEEDAEILEKLISEIFNKRPMKFSVRSKLKKSKEDAEFLKYQTQIFLKDYYEVTGDRDE